MQSIQYNANGLSTAVINHTSVSVGSHIHGYDVVAISRYSATIASPLGQRHTLKPSKSTGTP